MNRFKAIVLLFTLGLIASTAFALNWMRAHQKLGKPGIEAMASTNGIVMNIELPENVLDYSSTNVPQEATTTNLLPPDTSYAQRLYWTTNGFWANANIILMGADRSSIHKADYCLAGQGWQTLKKEEVRIRVPGPEPYEMPITKWSIRKIAKQPDGSTVEYRGVYSFWFVADGLQTIDNNQRILWSYRDLLTKGVLQRWAYISYLVVCHPGQEEVAFERLQGLITASVPEYQRPLQRTGTPAMAKQ
jgi:hypothetical protein